jgi:hypothetical protein
MKTAQHLALARVAWSFCVFAIAACRSARAPEEVPRPITRAATHAEELTLIRADSEMFDGVVRAQLEAKDGEYPSHLERLRYDARPYGTPSGYPEIFAGVQGIDPTLSFPRAGKPAIDHLAQIRREILRRNGVPEGGPTTYKQCAGVRVPAPPPPRGASASRAKRPDVHAGCPKTREYYLTVGLPVRGQPAGLWNARDSRGDRVSLRGDDVWTALVDVHAAGPNGWSWSQYAWIFRRDRSGRAELANTILIGVVE